MSESAEEVIGVVVEAAVPRVGDYRGRVSCPTCGAGATRNGYDRLGQLRWRCMRCAKGFKCPRGERRPGPVGRVTPRKAGSEVLVAYRSVLANEKRFDRGGLEAAARRAMEADPKGFLLRYDQMEREEGERREVRKKLKASSLEVELDAGSDAAGGLIEGLLATLIPES